MSPTFAVACHAVATLEKVRTRLAARGAVVELDLLSRLSAAELDLLILREMGGR